MFHLEVTAVVILLHLFLL